MGKFTGRADVTVCGNADERCPVLPPGVRRIHWPLEDPASVQGTDTEIFARFREVRDRIEVLFTGLLRELMEEMRGFRSKA